MIVYPSIQTEDKGRILAERINEWIGKQEDILRMGKTMKIMIHIKNNDVKGDITIFPDHC